METPSTMLPLGTKAPDFKLPDTVSGKNITLQQLQSKIATVIMFISNHCPYVKHVIHELINIANEYQAKGISFVAICSNDIANYPDDSPENMRAVAKHLKFPFPYLFDETQEVAKAYQAACTPDLFVFDKKLFCVYRGQLDDARPRNNKPVNGKDLRAALDNILANKPIDSNQKPSTGCNIKWK
jgi:peroxiredoxin